MKALVFNISSARWLLCKSAGLISTRAFYGALAPIKLVERPFPEIPGPGWVRLKTILGGICGTDLAVIALRNHPATTLQNFARFPAILGHENVALIDEIGPGIPGWQVGQRVCVEPALGCQSRDLDPPCPQCQAGRTSLCEAAAVGAFPPRPFLGMNPQTSGSWAPYFLAHRTQLHAVPEAVPDDVAVLADPLASAAHAVLRRPPKPGERVLVHGSGIIALGIVASIRALGLDNSVTQVVRRRFQADLAKALGANRVLVFPRGTTAAERYEAIARECGGRRVPCRFGSQDLLGGFDLTYDCTGTGTGLSDAAKWIRSRGTLVVVGTSGITVLDTTSIWFNELEVVGANGRQIETLDGRNLHTYEVVFEWLCSGRLNLSPIKVSRYKLAEYRTAFAQLLSPGRHGIIKAAFEH